MTESNLPTLAESQGDICYSAEDYDKPYTPRPEEKHRKLINGYLSEVEIEPDQSLTHTRRSRHKLTKSRPMTTH